MAVDINGFSSNPINTQRSGKNDPAPAPRTAPSPQQQAHQATLRGDSVSLSAQFKDLKHVEQRLRDQPEIDDGKVESIRKALSDGSFRVDAEKLAQKMLEFDKSIFG